MGRKSKSEEPRDVQEWRVISSFHEYKALSQRPLHGSLTTSYVTTRKSIPMKELMVKMAPPSPTKPNEQEGLMPQQNQIYQVHWQMFLEQLEHLIPNGLF